MRRTAEIRKVLVLTLALNLLVSAAKIVYGQVTHSVAIFSDGFHSLFDGVSNVVGLVGIYLASHPPDETHPYGHRKYETVFTIFIGVLMFATCIEIFKKVIDSFAGTHETVVTAESFVIMTVTVAVNLFVTTYEKRMGTKLGSEFLLADSRHTRSDIMVTLGVIASLVFLKLGFPQADPVAGLLVAVFVAMEGVRIIHDATESLVDRQQTDTTLIKEVVCRVDGVVECHEIRTRGTKSHIFVDVHVLVDPAMTVENAHRIADRVEDELKNTMPEVVDVIIHIEPSTMV